MAAGSQNLLRMLKRGKAASGVGSGIGANNRQHRTPYVAPAVAVAFVMLTCLYRMAVTDQSVIFAEPTGRSGVKDTERHYGVGEGALDMPSCTQKNRDTHQPQAFSVPAVPPPSPDLSFDAYAANALVEKNILAAAKVLLQLQVPWDKEPDRGK